MRVCNLLAASAVVMIAGHVTPAVADAEAQVPETAPEAAPATATILLKSGIRVSGVFEDMENDELQVRISPDEERRIPVDGVLVIDLAGTAQALARTETDLAFGRDHVLVLTDGSIWQGTLQDVHREGEGGQRTIENAPVTLVFQHDGETERVPLASVARLYLSDIDLAGYEGTVAEALAEEPVAPATTTVDAVPEPGFVVDQPAHVLAMAPWTPTQIVVAEGDLMSFHAEGEITIGSNELASPDGSEAGRRDAAAPVATELAGALIGRVGSGVPFGIGSLTVPIRMPTTGRLYLGVNESPAELADNAGQFTVTVTK